MAIHVTPIPRLTTLVAPAYTLGTANAAGSASTAVPSDSTLLVFDTSNPSDVSVSPAVGSSTVAPRRDHVHAMPQATKAEAEAETDVDKYLAPDFVRYSPGVAKAWCRIEQDGSILGSTAYPNSYNVSATSSGGTGDYTVTWADDFSQTTYTVESVTADAGGYSSSTGTYATGSVQIYNTTTSSGAATALRSSVVAYGDQ